METVEYGLCRGARPCRLLLEEGLTGREAENTGEEALPGGRGFHCGQETHGGSHPSLRQAGLCWMPQPLPALCLPEPSASSRSLRTRAASCLHLFHSSIPASCHRKPQP
ncbi:similar to B-cell CLL/lymphoma 7B, isoform CRA_a [Rattus norvegicus]|uniref:Similar to B-cell CLL/lymphoma 7B, isoform CRA_a n=1 Tax=Rattus norvegicus TaxID=10116 RepID=A6J0E3_RAT|nr:similar to B-cell CLL/lymphoma 7B, isoform CRA_a [Rattus norvegicus]|eukprot:NP_001102491.1 B-cell CLL/lymphoma 7 protein family member B [Rattus norvegicus]